MTDQAINIIEPTSNSFVGLNAYTEVQSKIFFGRDEEIEQLTKMVKFNTLTILFGKSGTGKTSLLNAGVFPRLRNDYCLPFKIRLEFKPESPELITQVKQVLKEEIDNYGFQVASYPGNETLWEYFHREPLWKTITPILIFDQFEEIFTLAGAGTHFGEKEFAVFWEELSDLIENFIPKSLKDQFLNRKEEIDYDYNSQRIKVMFSFREEYLAEFESFTEKIPSIKLSRFRLMPMNEKQAYQVVKNTWGDKITRPQAEKVVSYFAKDPSETRHSITVIEPSLLSQVCTYVEKERVKTGEQIITDELLNKYSKEYTLRAIYEEAMAESNAVYRDPKVKSEKKQPAPMSIFVQEKLITDKGFRTRYNLSQNDKDKLLPGIQILDKKYFLRLDDSIVELTHDVLAPLIKTDRENRRKEAAAAEANRKAWRIGWLIVAFAVLAGLGVLLLSKCSHDNLITKANVIADSTKAKAKEVADSTINSANTKAKQIINAAAGIPPVVPPNVNPIDVPAIDPQFAKKIENLNNSISNLRDSISFLNSSYISLQNVLKNLREKSGNEINTQNDQLRNLNRQIENCETRLTLAQQNFTKTLNLLNDCKEKPCPACPECPRPNKTAILLNIKNNTGRQLPSDLAIYLIPVKNNGKIINAVSLYETHCNDNIIAKASGLVRTANYYNGQYFFNDVPKGEYLVKVCTYYGDYKPISRKADVRQPVELELSPPTQ